MTVRQYEKFYVIPAYKSEIVLNNNIYLVVSYTPVVAACQFYILEYYLHIFSNLYCQTGTSEEDLHEF